MYELGCEGARLSAVPLGLLRTRLLVAEAFFVSSEKLPQGPESQLPGGSYGTADSRAAARAKGSRLVSIRAIRVLGLKILRRLLAA